MVKIWAIVKANFLTQWRYQVNFWLQTLSIFVIIFPSLTLTFNDNKAIWGFSSGIQYSFYLLVALSIWSFVECLWSFTFQLRSEMKQGIYDENQLLPISMNKRMIIWSIDGIVSAIVSFLPLFMLSILYSFIKISLLDFLASVLIILISVFSGYSLGVILMGLMLVWKECDQFVSFIGNIAPFICGMLVPLVNMPIGLRLAGLWMPFTWGLDSIRCLLFGYETLLPIPYEMGILFVLTGMYYIVSKLIFVKLNRLSKKKGGIIGY
ncbi:ABC transporter permease [Bulleidia sp. zg-1006]|uniref:ABC transporter permease n=1 Tax=Bulleidia sp. zg-1006 TaxID=2806552 RepID=UPI00193A8D6D|nr:ABC transporter permease [Bulleidia sp. zg-1006]QRG86705.1 ABC transporter permease [Bulleidia sp. zg-1006]